MAAQKRKSVLTEPPSKQRKLDKNSKSLSTNKERKLLGVRHVSNKTIVQKKQIHKISTKKTKSAVNKSIIKTSKSASHTKQVRGRTKQTLNELNTNPCKTVCVKKANLKSLGRLSSTKTPSKTPRVNHTNCLTTTKTSSKVCSGKKRKSSSVKIKACIESKSQKLKSSADITKSSAEVSCNKHSVLRIGTRKKPSSETKLKENCNDRPAKARNFPKSSNINAAVQSSKNALAKNSTSQNSEQTSTNSLSNQGNQIAARSTDANKSTVQVARAPLCLTKMKKEAAWKLSKSQPAVPQSEHLARRSPRLQQLSDVPVLLLRSRKIKGSSSAAKQCSQIKKQVPCMKNGKLKPEQQKMEQKPVKNRGKEIPSSEEMSYLKEKQNKVDPKIIDLAPQEKCNELKNASCSLQEPRNEPANTVSCHVTSSCSVVSKGKTLVHRNGRVTLKAKRVLSAPLSPNPTDQPEDTTKSKKFSILELCEEIAGEIESDTVEVKTNSNPECGKEEEKDARMDLPQIVTPEKESNQNIQCKRFFPSQRKTVKCTVNGRRSTANKNSKWTKIKLTKANCLSKSATNSSSTPKFILPDRGQVTAAKSHHPDAPEKLMQSCVDDSRAYEQTLNAVCLAGMQAKEQPTLQAAENGLVEARSFPEPSPDEVVSFNT